VNASTTTSAVRTANPSLVGGWLTLCKARIASLVVLSAFVGALG
jgi:hypothetical protein